MDTSEFDIEFLSQKLSENPQSPLFARLADLYLQKEQHSEALKLCEEGIQQFPKYYAGYLVLGKVCLTLKEYSTARDAFQHALELSPFNELIAKLIASVPDQPDESTRTSEETYFEPPRVAEPVSLKEQISQQFAEQAASHFTEAEITAMEEKEVSNTNVDEALVEPPPGIDANYIKEQIAKQFAEQAASHFTQPEISAGGEEKSGDASEDFSQNVNEPGQWEEKRQEILSAPTAPAFPSFDEYYSQHQSRVQNAPAALLDEYLTEKTSAPDETLAAKSESIPPISKAPTSQTGFTPEQHEEPEQVFASPEQAQLFAEIASEASTEKEKTQPTPKTTIDDLAEKLQKVERIIPHEKYQPQTPGKEETPEVESAESDMVTPTLAEIYASQGEYSAAIQAYEILLFSHPGKAAEYQQRIRELQQKQMEKEGLI